MIVICEQCGKKYQLNPSKIKGREATANCNACGNKIRIYHPEPELESSPPPVLAVDRAEDIAGEAPVDFNNHKKQKKQEAQSKTTLAGGSKKRFFGLRGKIFALFFVVPVALIIIAGYLFIGQLTRLSATLSDESAKMVTTLAEQIIVEKGRAVAREAKLYLDTHPDLKKENFNQTPEFTAIAMQKVGETGYTLLVERETEKQPEYMWVHPNKDLVGVDITDAMKQRLGDKWARWDAVRSKSHETKGYYLWFDNKEKYCAGIPIEGTPFNIVSSTYIDEFTQPMINLQQKAAMITHDIRNIVLVIGGAAALLVALITLFYGNRLSSKIRQLTDVTDRISVGDMEVEIKTTDTDELGDLAQAIARMQDSIRLSIERLRRRKDRRAA